MCGSTEPCPGGWTHAGAFTFRGRVHNECHEAYKTMKPAMWELFHDEDGNRRSWPAGEGWPGFGVVLEAMKAPRVGDSWDIHHPLFKAWEHGLHNLEPLFEMMRPR